MSNKTLKDIAYVVGLILALVILSPLVMKVHDKSMAERLCATATQEYINKNPQLNLNCL